MRFVDFCKAYGILIDELPPPGRWMRYATVDHPRKKNGAVKYLGTFGVCQNHATMTDVATWKPDADAPNVNLERVAAQAAEFQRKLREGWQRAARRAQELMKSARVEEHPYLHLKGFPLAKGFVLEDGALLVPMRHWQTNNLQGAQLIRWLPEERKYEKKMLPGMRAKGAVFRIGSAQARRMWLVEGYATGLSVEAAVQLLQARDSVLVCFSAGNLMHVANCYVGERFVFADNDETGAGERAAVATGLPYCMSGRKGEDANDLHMREGIFRVANLMLDATQLALEPPS